MTALNDAVMGWAKALNERDALAARLAEAERDRLEATKLLFDWDATSSRTGSIARETKAFLKRVGYNEMTATLRATSSNTAGETASE